MIVVFKNLSKPNRAMHFVVHTTEGKLIDVAIYNDLDHVREGHFEDEGSGTALKLA